MPLARSYHFVKEKAPIEVLFLANFNLSLFFGYVNVL